MTLLGYDTWKTTEPPPDDDQPEPCPHCGGIYMCSPWCEANEEDN